MKLTVLCPGPRGFCRGWRALAEARSLGSVWSVLALLSVAALAACGLANGGSGPAATVRDFMQAAESRDLDRAYGAFAPQEVARSEIEALVSDQVLFEHFEDIKVDRWVIFAPPDSNRGRLTGTVAYTSGHSGRFEAEMVQGKNGWRLTRVNIIVGREKLRDYEPFIGTPTVVR